MRKLACALKPGVAIAVVAAIAWSPPSANASQTFGWDGVGTVNMTFACNTLVYSMGATGGGKSYFVPNPGGVITSFEYSDSPNSAVIRWGVFRRIDTFGKFRVIGATDPVTVESNVVNKYPVRIPAKAGDTIGFQMLTAGTYCLVDTGDAGDYLQQGQPPIFNVGAVQDLGGPTALQTALLMRAVLELDDDHDDWGDETQDLCVGVPGPDHGCPLPPEPPAGGDKRAPTLRLFDSGRQNVLRTSGVTVTVVSDEAGEVNASGRLRVAGKLYGYALLGAHRGLAQNVRETLKLRLTRKARRALRRARKALVAVTVGVRDAAGNLASVKQMVRVKR